MSSEAYSSTLPMMTTKSPFKVIIVGGSIAGLTLAHCLSKAGVDYIVLEKRKEIAPQQGASISIFPHGGRILQQLGIFYLVEEQIEPLHTAHQCFPDGFTHTTKAPRIIHERFGLPLAFLERRQMLRVLHDTLPDLSQVLVDKAVISAEREDSDLMRVTTHDGSVYHGNLVVGADGVHSRVRAEMWRLANSQSPGVFPEHEMSSMTVEFACVFGISSSVPKLKAGEQVASFNNGRSYLTFPGRNGRIFWFFLLKLDRKYSYSNAPRFSSTDAEKISERFADDHIWDRVCFRDLWKNREVFSFVNLEEHVFRKWHWERIVCIGDSMHKMAPNTGQGANTAIEDAAALVNCLHRALRATPDGSTLSSAEIDGLLAEFNRTRFRRLREIDRGARMVVRLQTRQNLFLKLLGRYYLPYAGNVPADAASKVIAGAEHLDFLPLATRSGAGWYRFRPGLSGTALIPCLYPVLALTLCVLAWIGNDFVRNRVVFT
ncbi:FAD-dependent urate hydroxylase [Aspergillus udagawae]|nr:FAD-dependent urate hydroxylase [Aspergillus udagawae]